MTRLFLCLLWLLPAVASFAQPSDAYLLNRMAAGEMPGASFLILKEGKWVYEKHLGKADLSLNKDANRQTIYMMASVSKTMIATAVMQLWEKGLIDLDVDINNYLPFPVRTPAHPNDSITTRMLLTHTSSIKDNWNVLSNLYGFGDSPISLDTFLRNYLVPGGSYYHNALNFYLQQPGTAHNYSNVGSTLAAYLVERITGDAFSHYCDTAIFQKICMDNTSFLLAGISDTSRIARPYFWDGTGYQDVGLYGYPDYPDGQLRTTITAMGRFMAMLLNHGSYEGVRVLDSTTVDYMLQQQTPVSGNQGILFYHAFSSNGDTVWGHNGGDAGVNTAMYFNRSNQTGVLVFTNGGGTSANSADIMADTLYKYGLTIAPQATDTFPACQPVTGLPGLPLTVNRIETYPNPTTGTWHILMPAPGVALLTNGQGAVVARIPLSDERNTIRLDASVPNGLYLVRFTDRSGSPLGHTKLLLQR